MEARLANVLLSLRAHEEEGNNGRLGILVDVIPRGQRRRAMCSEGRLEGFLVCGGKLHATRRQELAG